jgi:hypothetical protein
MGWHDLIPPTPERDNSDSESVQIHCVARAGRCIQEMFGALQHHKDK